MEYICGLARGGKAVADVGHGSKLSKLDEKRTRLKLEGQLAAGRGGPYIASMFRDSLPSRFGRVTWSMTPWSAATVMVNLVCNY